MADRSALIDDLPNWKQQMRRLVSIPVVLASSALFSACADGESTATVLAAFEDARASKRFDKVCTLWQAQDSVAKTKTLDEAQSIFLAFIAKTKVPEMDRVEISNCLSSGLQPTRVGMDDACNALAPETALKLFDTWRVGCVPEKFL